MGNLDVDGVTGWGTDHWSKTSVGVQQTHVLPKHLSTSWRDQHPLSGGPREADQHPICVINARSPKKKVNQTLNKSQKPDAQLHLQLNGIGAHRSHANASQEL